MVNKSKPILLVGHSALEYNGLIYGNGFMTVWTPNDKHEGIKFGPLQLERYHFGDMEFMKEIEDNIFLPTPEKAIIDTIAFLDKNCNEGELVEALQDYLEDNEDNLSELYKVADYYKVSRDKVDYWITEAATSPYISMG